MSELVLEKRSVQMFQYRLSANFERSTVLYSRVQPDNCVGGLSTSLKELYDLQVEGKGVKGVYIHSIPVITPAGSKSIHS